MFKDIEEVMANPAALGLPTFEQFKRSPQFYKEKFGIVKDDDFACVDKADAKFKPLIKKQRYFFDGFECKSLEEVERVANSNGVPIDQLKWAPEIVPLVGGKCEVHVHFKTPLIQVIRGLK